MGMEKILVPFWVDEEDIWIVVHGMQLAKRIGGKLFLLEIVDNSLALLETVGNRQAGDIGPHSALALRSIALDTNKKGVCCEYVQVKGDFCAEIVKFVQEQGINTVVLQMPGKRQRADAVLNLVHCLKEVANCKIELLRTNSRSREEG